MANRSYTSHSKPAFGFSLLKGILVVILVMALLPAISQDVFFNKVTALPGKNFQHVTGIVQDKQGFMWLASKNGLFRYDGYQMIHYKNSSLNSKSLATAKLESIAVDSSGIIWIGTFDAGLDRFDPATGTFTHFRHDPNDPSSISGDTVSVVLCDRDGFIWVGAKTLDRLDPKTNKFTHYRNDPGDPLSISSNEIRAIYEDRSGELWIGTGTVYGEKRDDPQEGGLNKLNKKSGKFTRYKHDPKNPNSLATNKVRAIFEDSKGNFWVGTSGDGLHSMNRATGEFRRHHFDPAKPDKLSRPKLGKNFPYDHITFIHEDVSGALWIGTAESGINHYDTRESKLTHFESARDTAGSFTDRTTWWAYSSRDGVLWISTLHGTLYRVDPTRTKIPFYPVDASGVTSIYEEPDHTLWIGTGKSGLIQMDKNGNTIKKFIHNPADPASCSSNDISCIEGDREGHLWIGTFGSGLNLFDKQRGSFKRFMAGQNGAKHLSNNMALVIYDAGEEDIWIGTFRGLNRMNKKTGKFRHYLFYPNEKEETGTNVVTSVLKDKYSKWWAGSWEKGGLQQFDPASGRYKTYLKGADILNIFEDHSGMLWISGTDGVFRYNRQLDSFYRFEDPLFLTGNLEVRNFLEDGQGELWLGTTAGIIRINRDRNETTLFGKNYGINGTELFYLAEYRGRDGKLYFGSQTGYFAFYPEQITRGRRPPELVISAFRISNKLILPGDNSPLRAAPSEVDEIKLNHTQNIFSFEFVGLDYTNPDENHHLFMLERYDADWNLAGSERKAIYFNVPPGHYVFKVKVLNSYGIWSEKKINIIISPPWWTTWWFRVGALLVTITLFYSIIRWRVRRKFRRQIEQSEKEKQLSELQRKTGELEMQALRAQMNPHFVFNSLNAINRFILQKDKVQASEYLTKFSRLVRMILQNSQSALITLESELDSLKLYLELEALRFDKRFEYKISVPKDLDIDMLKVPPLIIQPYAENAIWHGLMHKEENGHLFVDIRQEGEYLQVSVRDDGIGRKKSAEMTSKSATLHKSLGLKITEDRIAMLHRAGTQQAGVVINDLVNPDGSAAGTEVIIKIPIIYD